MALLLPQDLNTRAKCELAFDPTLFLFSEDLSTSCLSHQKCHTPWDHECCHCLLQRCPLGSACGEGKETQKVMTWSWSDCDPYVPDWTPRTRVIRVLKTWKISILPPFFLLIHSRVYLSHPKLFWTRPFFSRLPKETSSSHVQSHPVAKSCHFISKDTKRFVLKRKPQHVGVWLRELNSFSCVIKSGHGD